MVPALLGGIDTPGDAQAVAIDHGRAYVADGGRGLLIVDVTDPRHPVAAGTYDTSGSARGVAAAGGYAYVADDFRGLEIFAVDNPEAPLLVGAYDTPGRAVDVAVGGGFAYVADLNRGVQILDVHNPAFPILVRNFSTPGAAEGVALSDGRLFVADGFSGLLEIDVREPGRPVLAGAYDTPGIAADVAVSGGVAYVADTRHGLQIVRPNPAAPDPDVVSGQSQTLALPAGYAPGPYDVQLTQSDGAALVVPDGFLVCPRRPLAARLVAVAGGGAAGRAVVPALRFRLEVSGDEEFFTPEPRHAGRLLLPALPPLIVERFEPGPSWIDLRLDQAPDEAVVTLHGPDAREAARLWEEIRASGGIALPRLDTRSYGPLRLSVLAGSGGPSHAPGDGGPGGRGTRLRYHFNFEAGRLMGARAWGAGAELQFEVEATDPDGCEASTRASLREP